MQSDWTTISFVSVGDSISSLQAVARACKEGLGLSSRDIFRQETVEALAVVAVLLPSD